MVDVKLGWSRRPRRQHRLGLLRDGLSAAVGWALTTTVGWAQPPLAPPPNGPSAAPLASFPALQSYDLGPATLTQPGLPPPWQTMPVTLTGTLARPEGNGPFPVVLLLHGRHPGCHFIDASSPSPWPCPPGTETRFDQGLAYLAQALAEAGYAVLAPNLNAAYANAYGANARNRSVLADQRSGQILQAHLDYWASAQPGAAASLTPSSRPALDLGRLAMVGHSMGGGVAVALAQQWNQTQPDLPAPAWGPVEALLLISPTPSRSMHTAPAAYRLPDVPTTVVAGGCDRDIYDLSSLYYFETAQLDPHRQTLATAVLLLGANHNFFNTAVEPDDYYRQPDNDPLCNPQQSAQRLSRVDQETFLVQYALDFLAHSLEPPDPPLPSHLPGFATSQVAPDQLYGFPVQTAVAWPQARRQLVFSLDQADTVPALTTTGSVIVAACQRFQPCGQAFPRHPGFPSVLSLSWAKTGGQLRFPLPPDTNLQAFRSLQFRLAAPALEPPPTAPPGFAVLLRDQAGNAVRVEIPPTTPALRSLPPDPTHGHRGVQVYPSTVAIPLGQFSGIDLSRVASVELWFDADTEGQLYVTDVEFIRD